MKKLTYTLILSIIIISIAKAQSLKQVSEVGYIKVYTSQTYIYDDGIYRKEYAPFSILDEKRNLILKVGRALDTPFIIGLKTGTYFIIENNNNSTTSKPEIKIIVTAPTFKEVMLN